MEQKEIREQPTNKNSGKSGTAIGIEVIYYTDPLCCWSWVMEPAWRKLQDELGCALQVTYKMGGLLPSWKNFNDNLNSIRKPIHMGPEWMHAAHVSGVDIDNSIWITDPPSSSFPGCIAVKSAEFQSKESGARYLNLLRIAVMMKCRNIARTEVLLELAADLSRTDPSFDPFLFREDLFGKGLEAFKADWRETKYRGITRFPTLIFRSSGQNPTLLSGFHTYDSLLQATL